MPHNGEINKERGIYKNLCCGAEIVIPENVTFPECGVHISQPTKWINITWMDSIPAARQLNLKSRIEYKTKAVEQPD